MLDQSPPADAAETERIFVRATIGLAGVNVGDVIEVDPDDPYTARLIAKRFLDPLPADPPSSATLSG